MRDRSTENIALPRTATAVAVLGVLLWLAACATSTSGPPAPVTDVTATAVPAGVLVQWSGGDRATAFAIYRSTSSEDFEEVATVPGDRVSYADYALDEDGSYRYAVAAVGPGGQAEAVEQGSDEPVTPLDGVVLTLVLDGEGSVVVEGAVAPVACGADCAVGFAPGDEAVLTAVGDGLAFAGFSSPCPPTATCAIEMDGDKEIVALFRTHVLRLSLEGDATVDASVSPGDDRGVDECELVAGNDCLLGYTYSGGSSLKVSLNVAVAEEGGQFVGFGGACDEPQGRFCVVDVVGATEVVVRAGVPPVAAPDTFQAPQGAQLTVDAPGVLANDQAGTGAKAELVAFDGPGELDLAEDGSFTYTAANDALTPVTFSYRVIGALGLVSQPANVTLSFTPRPVAHADQYPPPGMALEDQEYSVPAPGVLANDQFEGTVVAELVEFDGPGELDLNDDGSFTFLPAPDFNGPVSFTYRARGDFGLVSEPATVTINVTAVNDPPSFALSIAEVQATTPFQNYSIPGVAEVTSRGGPDEQGQIVDFVLRPVPGGGNPDFFVAPDISADGRLTFVTQTSQGTARFDVVLRDFGGTANGGDDESAPQRLSIVITSGGGSGGGGGEEDGDGGGDDGGGDGDDGDDAGDDGTGAGL